MKRIALAFAAIIALAIPAYATGGITITMSNGTATTINGQAVPVGTLGVPKTLSDADTDRLINACMDAYPTYDTGTKNAQGQEIISTATPVQSAVACINGWLAGIVNFVTSDERAAAAAAASGVAPPINPQ